MSSFEVQHNPDFIQPIVGPRSRADIAHENGLLQRLCNLHTVPMNPGWAATPAETAIILTSAGLLMPRWTTHATRIARNVLQHHENSDA